MTTSAFPNISKTKALGAPVKETVLRDFSGGLRAVENEIVLKSKFATRVENVFLASDFCPTVRFGTKQFAQDALGSFIVDVHYFSGVLLYFTVDGTVFAVNDAGIIVPVWNSAIAAALPGSPAGWSTGVEFVTYTEMNGNLTVHNNIDKPIRISKTLSVIYEQDDATGTNINTPIARYITTVNDFVVVALSDDTPEIIISSKGTSGVWPGDTAPNNSVVFNLGSFIQERSAGCKGLVSYNNTLVVIFQSALVFVELGNFDASGNHVPKVIDTIEGVQNISHNLYKVVKNKLVFLASSGVQIVTRNNLTQKFQIRGIGEAVNIPLLKQFPYIKDPEKCFIVIDEFENRAFFFVHQEDANPFVLCMSYDENLESFTWSVMTNMPYTKGTTSLLKRIFFVKDFKIFQYGNAFFEGEDYHSDLMGDPEEQAINFTWELPWLDFNERMKTKELINVMIDAFGGAYFSLDIFIDKIMKKVDGTNDPALTFEFSSESVGYGVPSIGYGGGRPTQDQNMYRLPVKFKLIKFVFHGSVTTKFSWHSLGMLYRTTRYHR